MVYILAAIALIGLGFWALGRFQRANVAALAKRIRTGAGIAAGVGAVALTLRGLIGYAMPLATLPGIAERMDALRASGKLG